MATEYWNWQGEHVIVSSEVVSTVLAALGVDASTPEKAAEALDEHQLARWRRTLPATVVMRTGWTPWFAVHLPHGSTAEVWVDLEDGGQRRDIAQQEHWVEPEWVDGVQMGEATYQLPGDLPLGYHRLCARIGGSPEIAVGTLIVTPSKLEPEKLQPHLGLGAPAVLRSLPPLVGDRRPARPRRPGGLVRQRPGCRVRADQPAACRGVGRSDGALAVPAGFASVRNPIYLRIEDIDEYGDLAPAERDRVRALSLQARALSEDANALDRDTVWAVKREALQLLFGVRPTIGRIAEYGAYCDRENQGLVDFATWAAISDVHGPEWSKWPEELQDPTSSAVTAFRNDNPDAVEFHCWLQWQMDDQLARTQARAKSAGMSLGILHDLAVGVHPDGADAWALQHVLAQGIHVGAPPDAFNQQGQDWSQPPWRPDALAETGYAAWRDLVRAVMRHGGGLRIDHILGMFRLWWVTSPERPTEGTYVRYDHEALIGILVLEATRAGVTVVGEDLGTVEPWVRDYLTERGVLGTSVLWFERDANGKPLAPERWRELCLATVTTHDLPPTAGYLAGDHVELRNRLGLLTRPVAEELAVDEADRDAWLDGAARAAPAPLHGWRCRAHRRGATPLRRSHSGQAGRVSH